MFQRFKNWFVGAGLAIGGLFGYGAATTPPGVTIPEPSPTPYVSPSPSASPTVEPLPTATHKPSPTPSVSRVQVDCDYGCTVAMKAELPGLVKIIIDTEASKCFEDFFLKQTRIDNNQGLSGAQIVMMIRNGSAKTTLSPFSFPWFDAFNRIKYGKTLGYENGDGKIHVYADKWINLPSVEKASLMAHEISHTPPLSFTHNGNSMAGNEQTVPYLINAGFNNCAGNP